MPKRDKENQNPTAEARFAMCHWPDWYSSQRGGSMDFYLDVLNKGIIYMTTAESTRGFSI